MGFGIPGQGTNPLAYTDNRLKNCPVVDFPRVPGSEDNIYPVMTLGRDNTTNNIYILTHYLPVNQAQWSLIGGASGVDTAMANFIVDPLGDKAEYTTVSSALAAASSGDTIGIKPGVYTENLTLKEGVNLVSLPAEGRTTQVEIVGKLSADYTGMVSIAGIALRTNSDYIVEITGSSSTHLSIFNCYFTCSNNTGIRMDNANSRLEIWASQGDITNTGISFFSVLAGSFANRGSRIENSGGSSTISFLGGTALPHTINYCQYFFPIATSGMCNINLIHTTVNTFDLNTPCINHGSAGRLTAYFCIFRTNNSVALTLNSASSLLSCVVDSSAANAIDGTGNLTYDIISFSGTSSNVVVSTQSTFPKGPNGSYSGTSHLRIPRGTTAERPGSPLEGMIRGNTTDNVFEYYNGSNWREVGLIESGSWTPSLEFGGASTGITYNSRSGIYYKIGDLVFFVFNINLSSKGTATGTARIIGLGFSPSETTTGVVQFSNLTYVATHIVPIMTDSGGFTCFVRRLSSGSALLNMNDTNFNNDTVIDVTGSFLV